jgi:hypothetical protein
MNPLRNKKKNPHMETKVETWHVSAAAAAPSAIDATPSSRKIYSALGTMTAAAMAVLSPTSVCTKHGDKDSSTIQKNPHMGRNQAKPSKTKKTKKN